MDERKIKQVALGGLLSAFVFLFTYFLKIPVPATGGYVHLGDGPIFLAALVVGPYAALIGAVGSVLADLLGGYAAYIIPTFCIKAAMGGFAGALVRKGGFSYRLFIFALAECIMVAGYFLFEGFAYGWAAALAAVLPNVMQGVAGIAIGAVLCVRLQRRPL